MAAGDLTDLASVKAWLGVTDNSSDTLLGRLITAASRAVCSYCGRGGFASASYTDLYDGNGKEWMLLRQWPVISIQSISYDAAVITLVATGVPLSNGYLIEPALPAGGNQRLTLFSYCFPRGRSNVQVAYTAGYASTPEDVAQATIELVGEAFRRKDRIGQTSKTLGGQETIAYSTKDMNDSIKAMLSSYRRLVPV